MIPATSQRVPLHTSEKANCRIWEDMEQRIAEYRHASPAAISRRLEELDSEWDTERFLEANAAIAMLTGCVLATKVDRRWLALSAAVAGFLFQHAVQGWCPPLPVIRRLGFRTEREIDYERTALKMLRGDFRAVDPESDGAGPRDLLQLARC